MCFCLKCYCFDSLQQAHLPTSPTPSISLGQVKLKSTAHGKGEGRLAAWNGKEIKIFCKGKSS